MSKFYPAEKYVGLSCLSVGTGAGGTVNMLARATVIDYSGKVLFDSFVRPTEPVINYKSTSTGIEECHLSGPYAKPFEQAQSEVLNLIKDKIIIGYCLWNDLAVLGITHRAIETRDVALYLPFREALGQKDQVPGLLTLVWNLMNRRFRAGYENSAEDARACVDLFRSAKDSWESYICNDDWPCALPPVAYAQYIR